MAIIYSYPTVIPEAQDLVLGTDVGSAGKPTKNFTVQSLVDLIAGGVNGLGAVITANSSAKDANGGEQSATGFNNITGIGNLNFLGLNSTNIVNTSTITTLNLTATGTIQGLNIYGTTFKTSVGSGASWQTTVLSGFTSVGTQSITVSGAFAGAAVVQTMPSVAGGSTTKVVSEKGIIDYIGNNPAASDSLAEVLNIGNETKGATAIALVGGGTGYPNGISVQNTTVAPTGGTGLTVNINVTGGVIGSISIAAPGTGYANADVITVANGTSGTANLTVASNDIVVSEGDDITFTDSSKILMGAGPNVAIEHDGTDFKIVNTVGDATISNSSGGIDISVTGGGKKINIDGKAGIDLIFDTTPRVSVLDTGAKINGVTTSTGVFQGPNGATTLPTYGFTSDVNTGMYGNGSGEIKLTSNGDTHYTFANAGATFTNGATPPGLFLQSDTFTTTTTTGLGKITRFVLSTDPSDPATTPATTGMFAANLQLDTMVPTVLAVKTYTDTVAGAKTLDYEADSASTVNASVTGNGNVGSITITIVANANILPGMTIAGAAVTTTNAKVITNVGTTLTFDKAVAITGTSASTAVTFSNPFAMNLDTDILDIAGTTNQIATTATAVTSNKAEISVALTDDVVIPGYMQASSFRTATPVTAKWVTTVLSGFTLVTGDSSASLLNPIGGASNVQFQGNASKANQLFNLGNILVSDNVTVYPTVVNATNLIVANTATTITYAVAPSPNRPVVGQVITGTGVVSNTKVTIVSADGLTYTVTPAQTGIAADTSLTYTTPSSTYTKGGNINIPTFIPDTVATSKFLTNFSVPFSPTAPDTLVVAATDNILIGLEKLQTQITALPSGLDYLGTWDARDSISTGLTAAAETAANIVVLTVPNFNILVDTVISGFVSGESRTVTAVSSDFLSITFGGATEAWALGLSLTFTAPASANLSRGGNPDLINGTFTAGQYYVVATSGSATPNGTGTLPNEWKAGDWAIYGDATLGSSRWQKLDNTSSIEGSGAVNKIARWTGPQTLGTGLIEDNGTTVAIGNSGNLTVEGNTTLGNAASDTTIASGPLTATKNIIINEGIRLGATDYGTTAKALFSGGAAASVNTWTEVKWTISDGTNESDIANAGTATFASGIGVINTESSGTVTTALRYEDENANPSSGALNFIDAAATSTTPLVTDFVLFSDQEDTSTKTSVKKALISKLPFNSYLWKLDAASGGSADVTNNEEVDFVGANGITITKAYADPTHTVTITGVADPVTGTGTALNLPVWNSGGTSIGDSMVSQDAATGTTLTIAGVTPTLAINDTTAGKGDLKISRALDATTYMSAGITTPSTDITYGTHVFSQTDGTTPRDILTLDASQNAVFAGEATFVGDVGIGDTNPNAKLSVRVATDKNLEIDDQTGLRIGALNNVRDAFVALKFGASSYEFQTGNATFNGDIILPTNAKAIKLGGSAVTSGIGIRNAGISSELRLTSNSIKAVDSTTPTTPRFLYLNGDVCEINSNSASGGVNIGNNSKWNGGAGTLTDLNVYGDLDVRGSIIHSGGGGGTGKGGTFTNLFTTQAGARTAFTISRATSGAMAFDVWLTSDTSATTSVAKKFTIVKSHATAPIVYKILDTGPDGATIDFTVDFSVGANDLTCLCEITPVTTTVQKIGITIDLGFGQYDATVVMPAT